MAIVKKLSKTQYTKGLQCGKALWLYRNKKELADEVSDFQESIMEAGTEFGELARQRWPGGVLIKADSRDPEAAVAETLAAIAAGATVLYEAAFVFDDVLVRVDVLVAIGPSSAGNVWQLYEVKSGTKVEEVHLDDVAIQRYVLEGAGQRVPQSFVVHANPTYVRKGALDLEQLFAIEEVTKEMLVQTSYVAEVVKRLKAVAELTEAPKREIGDHCNKPYACAFKGHCWAHVPEYSVFNIPYAKMDKKLELFNSGIKLVSQVDPKTAGLTDKRSIKAVEVARLGKPVVDKRAIAAFLGGLTYPITHLDFETDNPPVPPYDDLSPYSQMPFQASVRVQEKLGGRFIERGFLGDGLEDPRSELVEFLCDAVPRSGTVLAYYKPFEAGRIKELYLNPAVTDSKFQTPLRDMEARLQDLADPFSKNWYTHPGFLGKWSIKNVLPVVALDMTYKNLEVQNGAQAMAAYAQLRNPSLDVAERARIMNALKVYCAQDTEAMVRILSHLYAVVA